MILRKFYQILKLLVLMKENLKFVVEITHLLLLSSCGWFFIIMWLNIFLADVVGYRYFKIIVDHLTLIEIYHFFTFGHNLLFLQNGLLLPLIHHWLFGLNLFLTCFNFYLMFDTFIKFFDVVAIIKMFFQTWISEVTYQFVLIIICDG